MTNRWTDGPGPRLRDVSEDELLAQIFPLLPRGGPVVVAPGDDTALVRTAYGSVLATTDTMVRGRDWLDEWSSPADVGGKSVAQNVADIASMGGRATALLVTLVALVLAAAVALMLAVSGPIAKSIGDAIGFGETALTVWNIVRWPILLLFVILIVAILYWATPNVQQPKFRWISAGAVLAIVTWIVASAAFALYVSNFGSYNKTYGALAGVIVFLLWLWLTNLALLFGAEFDSELERGRQLQAGMPAEEHLQLPPRDTTASDKNDEKDQKYIEQARALRNSQGK